MIRIVMTNLLCQWALFASCAFGQQYSVGDHIPINETWSNCGTLIGSSHIGNICFDNIWGTVAVVEQDIFVPSTLAVESNSPRYRSFDEPNGFAVSNDRSQCETREYPLRSIFDLSISETWSASSSMQNSVAQTLGIAIGNKSTTGVEIGLSNTNSWNDTNSHSHSVAVETTVTHELGITTGPVPPCYEYAAIPYAWVRDYIARADVYSVVYTVSVLTTNGVCFWDSPYPDIQTVKFGCNIRTIWGTGTVWAGPKGVSDRGVSELPPSEYCPCRDGGSGGGTNEGDDDVQNDSDDSDDSDGSDNADTGSDNGDSDGDGSGDDGDDGSGDDDSNDSDDSDHDDGDDGNGDQGSDDTDNDDGSTDNDTDNDGNNTGGTGNIWNSAVNWVRDVVNQFFDFLDQLFN